MLSRFDDYPVHQTPEPLAVPASSDRNVYDRYWMNAFPADASWYLGVAMGRYPHRDVVDGAISITVDGRQHSCFVSGRAPAEPTDTAMGPLRIEIVEPMRTLRLLVDDNASGLACDLTFTARSEAVEEKRQTFRSAARVTMDATRFAQFGRWEGTIASPDGDVPVDPAAVRGTKDRSWGIRRVGARVTDGAPVVEIPQFSFLWAPVHWDDRCTHVGLFEDATGRQVHWDGAVVPDGQEPTVHAVAVERLVEYVPGTRRAARAELVLHHDGATTAMQLEPRQLFQMKGIGYGHPRWGHGTWQGELAVGGETLVHADLDPLDLTNLHVQQLVAARSGDAEGMGALEQICIGPHAPSGFSRLNDGAD